jgi:hypothetical protein
MRELNHPYWGLYRTITERGCMEIRIQNKPEDLTAFFDYVIKETKHGKAIGWQNYRIKQLFIFLFTGLIGAISWGITNKLLYGISTFIFGLLIMEAVNLIDSKFKPNYIEGIRAIDQQLKLWTPKETQSFLTPRTITINEDSLEIESLVSYNRWQWRVIGQITVTTDFIFIFNRTIFYVIIPKRDFSSEQNFMEFGQRIQELFEKNKDISISQE